MSTAPPRLRVALLERMRQAGLTLVVATSAKQDEYQTLVEVAGV